jgi:hypothetical protein
MDSTTDFDVRTILANRDKWEKEAQGLRTRAAEQIARANSIDALLAAADVLATGDPAIGAPTLFRPEARVKPVHPVPPTTNGQMSTPDAVIAVMLTAPKKSWKAHEVLDELEKRGLLTTEAKNPGHKVMTTMARLTRAGKLKRSGYGKYRVSQQLLEGAA